MTTWQKQLSGPIGSGPTGRSDAWAAANPRSASLSQRARRTLPGGVTHDVRRAAPFSLAVARAVPVEALLRLSRTAVEDHCPGLTRALALEWRHRMSRPKLKS